MTKKIVAFILAFVFCFGCAAVFTAFGEGQLHVHAIEDEDDDDTGTSTSTLIENPTVIIRYSDGVSGPLYDFANKTLTLRILIKESDHVSCRSGRVEIKYDADMFDFSSISGSFMEADTSDTETVIVSNENGLLTISVRTDSTEPYSVASEFDVQFSFARVDLETLTEREKTFNLNLVFSGSKYKNTDNKKSNDFVVMLCQHNAADIVTKDFEATCHEYAHRDTICTKCGTVLNSVTTGDTYVDHVYDYENIVRYIYSSGYTDCDPLRANKIVAEVKCQVCGKLQWAHDLEYHVGLDTSVKRYDETTHQYYYACTRGHRVIAIIQSPGTSNPTTHEHTYVLTGTQTATCTEVGYNIYKCSVCNEEKREEIPATGHTYGNPVVIKQPTCTEAGEQTLTCTVCGKATKTESVPALGHDFDHGTTTVITAPTCVSTGTAIKKCARCGVEESVMLPIDPAAHRYGDWVTTTPGTCVTKEVRMHTCSLCGNSESVEFDFGDHDYTSEVIVAPTCYEDGVRTYTCKYCGDTYDDVEKCAGHKFGAPVSDGKGTTTVTCTECGMSVATTVKSNKTTKTVSHGPFTLTIKNTDIASRDIQLRVTEIDRATEEYANNSVYLNALNAGLGKKYSIQNAYHVTLYIDGAESKMTSDMTLSLGLDSALSSSKTAIVYYTESGSSTMISVMNEASRRKLVVTMPGTELERSASDTIILAVEGASVTPSGDSSQTPVTPPAPSGDNGFILPAIIIAVAVVVTLVVIVVVLKKSKKNGFDF
ncbi:MAG: hypothetical protein IKP68_03515 [Clostridia bacterium]|nr:hypothetical protein [Clostridia bacterium]